MQARAEKSEMVDVDVEWDAPAADTAVLNSGVPCPCSGGAARL